MSSFDLETLKTRTFDCNDPQLLTLRERCRLILNEYNGIAPNEKEARQRLLTQLFGYETDARINSPFYCDYGTQIRLGRHCYMNVGCTLLDSGSITIGDHCLFGPHTQLYTSSHPFDPEMRRADLETAAPIVIGDDVWLGGGVIVCPGVTIGARSVVGAGSVVTRDIPPDSLYAGNPARFIRSFVQTPPPDTLGQEGAPSSTPP
ncbi:Maltose O-acetyltransferase [Giardia muris]|uniref:Maltose O-acetyltransferase n=1 Tax=Giardia muris TaxID=5742 RepID=A0A4Z1T2K4_GIAMU|nr:Maltose O-acetyltransferase [Giardia muris]|eukprot:TNJ26651.1 Maltose O-acetyltransferase [Giardia muris]